MQEIGSNLMYIKNYINVIKILMKEIETKANKDLKNYKNIE